MVKMKYLAIIFFIFVIKNDILCQNYFYVSGILKGAGTGKKIYLGNKPNGIGQGFKEFFFDSTFTKKDSFYFKKIRYKYSTFYSVETSDHDGWVPFLSDTGHIYIRGRIDTIYRSSVSGSGNQDLHRKYYKDLYRPWDAKSSLLMQRLPRGNNIDSSEYKKIMDSVMAISEIYRKNIVNFYIEHLETKPYAAFLALRMLGLQSLSDSTLKRYFNMLPASVQNSPPLEDVKYQLSGFRENIQSGKQIPKFYFLTPEMKKTTIDEIDAKYKLLVFWASWCGPCLEEIPVLDSLNTIYRPLGLKVLCINVDNLDIVWKKNISKYTFDCIHLYQGGYSQSEIYKYFKIEKLKEYIK
jgi:thiol-disulfide isomerase/thioredoxin